MEEIYQSIDRYRRYAVDATATEAEVINAVTNKDIILDKIIAEQRQCLAAMERYATLRLNHANAPK